MKELIIYGNISFIYISNMVLSLNINSVKDVIIAPVIRFVYLCALIDFNGILLDIVYIIILRYMNVPMIHWSEMIFSILSKKPNSFTFLNTIYSEYSNVLTKSIPNTPNVVITNPRDIMAPIR